MRPSVLVVLVAALCWKSVQYSQANPVPGNDGISNPRSNGTAIHRNITIPDDERQEHNFKHTGAMRPWRRPIMNNTKGYTPRVPTNTNSHRTTTKLTRHVDLSNIDDKLTWTDIGILVVVFVVLVLTGAIKVNNNGELEIQETE